MWMAGAGVLSATEFVWTGAGGSSWSEPSSWSPNGVPGLDDDATINSGVVDLVSDATVRKLNLSGGRLTGVSTLTILGGLHWTGGRLDGSGTNELAAGSVSTISGSANKELAGRTLKVGGTLTWTGAGSFIFYHGTVDILSGGLLDIQTTAALGDNDDGASGQLVVHGTLRRSVDPGTSWIGQHFGAGGAVVTTVPAGGRVEVQSGVLQFLGGGGSAAGVLDISSGARLALDTAFTLDAGAVISGAGSARNSSTLTVAGAATVTGTLEQQGTLTGAGTLTVPGRLDWTTGTLSGTGATDISAGGTLNLSGAASKTLSGRPVSVGGTATWTAGDIVFYNGTLTVLAGGLFDIQTDADLRDNDGGGPGEVVVLGTLRKSAGAGTTAIGSHFGAGGGVNATVGVGGVVQVTSGTLQFDDAFDNQGTARALGSLLILAGGGSSSGTFERDATGSHQFTGGTQTLSSGAGFVGDGQALIAGGRLDAAAGAVVNVKHLTLSSGYQGGAGRLNITHSFTWTGGRLDGSGTNQLAAGSVSTMSGGANKELAGRTLNLGGTLTWTGAGSFIFYHGTVDILSGGLLDIQTTAALGDNDGGGAGQLVVHGTLRRSVNTGTSWIGSHFGGGGAVVTTVPTGGRVEVQSGVLQIVGGGGSAAGVLDISGGAQLALDTAFTLDAGAVISGAGSARNTSTLTVAGAATVTGTLQQQGTLTGAGTLTVPGRLDWTTGTLSGAGATDISAGGTLNLSGAASKTLSGRPVNVSGTATWTAGDIVFYNGTLTVLAGGLFDIQTDADVRDNDGGAPGEVVVLGTLRKSAGAGTTAVGSHFGGGGGVNATVGVGGVVQVTSGTLQFDNAFNNHGSAQAQGSVLILAGGGNSSGTFERDAAGLHQFTGGTQTLTSGAGFVGDGQALVAGGRLDVAAGAEVNVKHLTLSSGYQGGAGRLNITHSFTWTGGRLDGSGTNVLAAGSVSTMSGSASKELAGRTLNLGGTLTWAGAGSFVFYHGTVDILSGGLLDIQTTAALGDNDGGASGQLVVHGTLRRSVNTGTSWIGSHFGGGGAVVTTVPAGGRVEVQSGVLQFLGGGGSAAGVLDISGGARLALDTAFTLDAGAVISGAGSVRNTSTLTVAGAATVTGTLEQQGTLTGAGTLTVPGRLDWTSGTLSGTGATDISPSGTLNLSGAASKTLSGRPVNVGGTATWTAGDIIFYNGTLTVLAGGLLDIQTDADLRDNDGGGPGEVVVLGTLRKSAGVGTTAVGSHFGGGGGVNATVGVGGVVQVTSGTLQFDNACNNQGALEIWLGYLRVSGSYAPGATSSLKIGLGGSTAGSGHGQLAVAGTVTLAGQIQAAVTGGFTPSLGQEFTVLTCASRVGAFINSTVDAGSGVTLSPDHRATSVVLVATNPPQLAVVPGSTNVVAGQAVQFAAINGTPPSTFAFATNNSGGSLTAAGFYTAGTAPGVDTVRVTDSVGSNATAAVTIVDCTAVPGAIAWWRGEDNTLDGEGAHDGTLNNGASYTLGRVGRAFAFDGVDDSLSVPDSPAWDFGTADLTIEFWLKLNAVENAVYLHQQSSAAAGGFEFWYYAGAGELYFNANSSYTLIQRPWSPVAGNWYHVAVVRNASVCRLYVNGAQLGADQADGTAIANVAGPLLLGNWAGGSGYELNGVMDELAIYHRALPAAEIQAIFTSGSAGKCSITPTLQLAPSSTNVFGGGMVQFTSSGGRPPHTFALATNNSGGSITTAGLYTAGPGCGTDAVRVMDVGGSNLLAMVVVNDSTLPTPYCPSDIVVDCTGGSGGQIVEFAAPVSDNCDPQPASAFLPASGSLFPPGVTVVLHSAVDASGNSNYCTFTVTVRDLTPPQIESHNLVAEATSGNGAGVTFVPIVTDNCDPNPTVTCVPPSGSVFPIGVTTVTCTARDAAGNPPNERQFTVTVRDTTPPAITTCPTNRNLSLGANCRVPLPDLRPELVASDVGGLLTITQTPTPGTAMMVAGHSFPVTFTVSDPALNTTTCTATVTLQDTTAPTLQCPPADLVVEATSPAGAVVSYGVTATDNCTKYPVLVSSPPSGGTFSIGTNLVTCSATDAAGNVATCSFKIIVRDTTPPGITCPANISVTTANPAGATVNFVVSASDLADTGVGLVCTPASGSVFPPGTTTVNCVATDDAGNTSSCSFTVTVTVVPTAFAVSGRVVEANNSPVAGVAVTLTGSGVKTSTQTDAGGNYVFGSVASGTYNFLASHPNFNVMPSSASVTIAGANEIQDFSALRTSFAIRGRVTDCVTGAGVPGVRVGATGVKQAVFTGPDGSYLLPKMPLQAKVYVQPSQRNAAIEPGSAGFTAPTSDVTADFCARYKVRVGGLVLDANGVGLNGTTVLVNGSVSTSVKVQKGRFSLTGLQGQSLTLTPTNRDYLFSPPSQSFPNLMQDVSVTFRGTALPRIATPGQIAYLGLQFIPSYGDYYKARVIADHGNAAPANLGPPAPRPDWDQDHAWSRDGSMLAFKRVSGNWLSAGGGIHAINADGSDFRRLTPVDEPFLINYGKPHWSPDGSYVSHHAHYTPFPNVFQGLLRLVAADGSGEGHSLVSDPRISNQSVPWSPDGTRIAFVKDGKIHSINTNGTGLTEFPIPAASIRELAWSPDGTRFAYIASCSSEQNSRYCLYVFRTNGGSPLLTIENAGYVAWSPDSSRLAYVRLGHRTASSEGRTLHTVGADGNDDRVLPVDKVVKIGTEAWGPIFGFETAAGANTTVGHADTTAVTFGNVTQPGETTITPLSSYSTILPSGYFSFGGSSAVQIETTAQTTGPISVCFKVPDSTSEATFNRLRIFHGEGGVLVDRTILPPDSPAPDYATRTICARVTSLSPFVIGEQIDTALPQITGLVVDTNGNPIVDAFVLLTGSATNETHTDLDGQFAFPNLSATGNYTVALAQTGLGFTPSEMNLPALGTGADILFVGTNTPPSPVPALAIAPDARFGNQLTLTWPGFLEEFVLESTDSLSNSNWSVAPELQLPVEAGVAVPLAPTDTPRFFRLRRP